MQRDFGGLLGTMQQNAGVFRQVPAGLTHYLPLVTTMQANVDNYRQVNSLPDFRLFTVFSVVPGALLVVPAGTGCASPVGSTPPAGRFLEGSASRPGPGGGC